MERLVGSVALLAVASVCLAEPGPWNRVAGFELTSAGFRVTATLSDQFAFPNSISKAKLDSKRAGDEMWSFPDAKPLMPDLVRLHQFGEGFDLHFAEGFALKIGSMSAPYVSWADGSVGDNVLSPEADYHMLSFKDNQPAVLLTYPGAKTTAKVTGKPGQWVIRSGSKFKGWMRVVAPFGRRGWPAYDAATLGAQVDALKIEIGRWIRHAPRLVSTEAEQTAAGLQVTWKFDQPDPILMPTLDISQKPGAKRRVILLTKAIRTRIDLPMRVVGNTLRATFPEVKHFPGRAMCNSPVEKTRTNALDTDDVLKLALANLLSSRSVDTRQDGFRVLNLSAQRMPSSGPVLKPGSDDSAWTAANCLLAQVVAPQARGEWAGALVTAVDPFQHAYLTAEGKLDSRAMAIASLALVCSPDPLRQAYGALLDLALSQDESDATSMKNLRDQAFGTTTTLGPFNVPYRQITGQPIVYTFRDGVLTSSVVEVTMPEQVVVSLPSSVGSLNNFFRKADLPPAERTLWVVKSENQTTIRGSGLFGPVAGVCGGIPALE